MTTSSPSSTTECVQAPREGWWWQTARLGAEGKGSAVFRCAARAVTPPAVPPPRSVHRHAPATTRRRRRGQACRLPRPLRRPRQGAHEACSPSPRSPRAAPPTRPAAPGTRTQNAHTATPCLRQRDTGGDEGGAAVWPAARKRLSASCPHGTAAVWLWRPRVLPRSYVPREGLRWGRLRGCAGKVTRAHFCTSPLSGLLRHPE